MTEIIKREIGEHVSLSLGFEPTLTKDLGNGLFEVVVTTSAKDRHGENILTDGISTDNWLVNPVVLYGHDYQGLPIGKGTKLTKTKNKLKAQFQLAVEEYPFAATVAAMIAGGYLNAASIGGIVRRWSDDYMTIEEMDMVEFSIVPVPANPEAIMTQRSLEKATGKSMEAISKEYHQFVKKNMIDKVAELEEDEISQAVKVLKSLTVVLEESANARFSVGEPATDEIKVIRTFRLKSAAIAVNQESERVIKLVKLNK